MTHQKAAAAAVLAGGLAALLARPLGTGPIRLEVGAFEANTLSGDWGRSARADLDSQATTDGRTSFYFRPSPAIGGLALPLAAGEGDVRLTLRGTARVRSGVSVFTSAGRAPEVLVRPAIWDRYAIEIPASARGAGPLDLKLALRPLPLVRGAHVEDPRILVDYFEVEAPGGLSLSWSATASVGLAPLGVFAFALLAGGSRHAAAIAAAIAAAMVVAVVRLAPLPALAALPRLLPFAMVSGLLAGKALARCGDVAAADRVRLAGLVAAAVVFHGSVVFFPDHNPPDIDIHVRRTRDLASVPFDYGAMLRYGSQLPTPSQDQGAATAALGERTLIPYSPLPYFAFHALELAGLSLPWAMTAFNAALASLVAPLLWLTARRVWSAAAAWLAALLYLLDLAVWHHLGRSHAPAVFGGALGTAALLYLAKNADRLDARRAVLTAAAVLGVAALGYSSSVVLFGLFGMALLSLLAVDAWGSSRASRRGLASALVLGGVLAGVLFYFHYVPGLLGGARAVEAEPDLFPGRTFFIFHNESRQSLRLWVLGFWIPVVAGLAAAPLALLRAAPFARPVLAAWLLAWAAIMVLKEPGLFPKLLRWAKEDQFLSPLLCLFIAAAATALPRARLRFAVAALVLAVAVWLQLRDFAHHANSLLL
jgi:hypothetical protein